MPDCYLLAVCEGSALDKDRNTFSLFNLVEEFQATTQPNLELVPQGIQPPEGPAVLPFEVHVYWQFGEEEIGNTLELRLVNIIGDERVVGERVVKLTSEKPRQRLRIRGLPVHVGCRALTIEWRQEGEDAWSSVPIEWPLLATITSQK